MTLEEFNKLLENYGDKPESWPADVREQCLAFAEHDAQARALLAEHWQLNSLLEQLEVPSFSGLEARVLNQALPPRTSMAKLSPLDRLAEWLLPKEFGLQLWRPAMAACLPLVFGIVVGNFYSFGIGLENDVSEIWEDELYMLSLNDYTEIQY